MRQFIENYYVGGIEYVILMDKKGIYYLEEVYHDHTQVETKGSYLECKKRLAEIEISFLESQF